MMSGNTLVVSDTLSVKGRGLSPRPSSSNDDIMRSMASSSKSSFEDDDGASAVSEEYTVLDGVRRMNHILVGQIETLRMKIQVDEKNHNASKAKLTENATAELQLKETEIENLKDSVVGRDETIHNLTKASQLKDKTIQRKCDEIEELKNLVKETESYATRLQRRMGRVRNQKDQLESDTLYKQQNEEISRLTDELQLLRDRLTTTEQELGRAMKVIEQQGEKMKAMNEDRQEMQNKFKEELDKASKAMRQEVERMREVMLQNYEEMRILREQNVQMHSDVRAIKEMLLRPKDTDASTTQQAFTGLSRPLVTKQTLPSFSTQVHGTPEAVTPKGPGKMVGGNVMRIGHAPGQSQAHPQAAQRESLNRPTQIASHAGGRGGCSRSRTGISLTDHSHPSGVHDNEASSSSRLSPDANSHTVKAGQAPRLNGWRGGPSKMQHLNVPSRCSIDTTEGSDTKDVHSQKNLPPICSVKDGVSPVKRHPSAKGGKAGLRKGSAVRK